MSLSSVAHEGLEIDKKHSLIKLDVEKDTYQTEYQYRGRVEANTRAYLRIPFGELDAIKSINAWYLKNGKKKAVKKKDIQLSSLLSNSFYSGHQAYFVYFPETIYAYQFGCTVEKESQIIEFLAVLNLQETSGVDSISYELEYSSTKKELRYEVSGDTSVLKDFSYSFNKVEKNRRSLKVTAVNSEKKWTSTPPVIRLFFHDKDQEPFEYFNNWYQELTDAKGEMSLATELKIDQVVKGIEEPEAKIEAVFDFVKTSIKYVSFENGIEAIQPRDVNKVLVNQQGDCKDMSNLLCHALQYLGFDARMAISSTLSHPFDLDFPGLSSANHVICVLEHEGKRFFLDATETYGYYNLPSRQIQGRSIFEINQKGGTLRKVPKVAAKENRLEMQLSLLQEKNKMQGLSKLAIYGMSRLDLVHYLNYSSSSDEEELIKKYLENWSNKLYYSSSELVSEAQVLRIESEIETERNFTKLENKVYLYTDFLPFPHRYPETLEADEYLLTYQTEARYFKVDIELQEAIKLQSPEKISFEKDGFTFEWELIQSAENKLQIKYHFLSDHLKIGSEQLAAFMEMNELIRKKLYTPISYELQ